MGCGDFSQLVFQRRALLPEYAPSDVCCDEVWLVIVCMLSSLFHWSIVDYDTVLTIFMSLGVLYLESSSSSSAIGPIGLPSRRSDRPTWVGKNLA